MAMYDSLEQVVEAFNDGKCVNVTQVSKELVDANPTIFVTCVGMPGYLPDDVTFYAEMRDALEEVKRFEEEAEDNPTSQVIDIEEHELRDYVEDM